MVWLDPAGDPVLLIARLDGEVDARAVAQGDILARDVSVLEPGLTIERSTATPAQWNVARAYTRLLVGDTVVSAPVSAPDDNDPTRIRLERVRIVDGDVDVRGADFRTRVSDIQGDVARVLFNDPEAAEPTIEVDALAGAIVVPESEFRTEATVTSARITFPDELLTFDIARIESGGSIVEGATGRWAYDSPGLGLDVRARASPVRFADLRFLVPELPESGDAFFAVDIESSPDGRVTFDIAELVATSADPVSEVRGAARFAAGGGRPFEPIAVDLDLDPLDLEFVEAFTGPLPYDGALAGSIRGAAAAVDIDLVARLMPPELTTPFELGLTGAVGYSRDGPVIHSLRAELRDIPLVALRPIAPGLPLRGSVSGSVVLSGPPSRAPLDLDVRLVLAQGTIDVAGVLDLTGAVPTYDFAGRISNVSLQEVVAAKVPPVSLVAAFTLAGRGFDLATASANLALDGRFTGWLAGPADAVAVVATLTGGVIDVDTATLQLSTLSVAAGGAWGLAAAIPGALTYEVAVSNLAPWGPYLPVAAGEEAAGQLLATGTVAGSPPNIQVTGTAGVQALALDDWRVAAGTAEFALGFGPPVPAISVVAAASDVVAGELGVMDTVAVRFQREIPVFALELVAERAAGTALLIQADGSVAPDGTHAATVHAFELRMPDDEHWTLSQPAAVRWSRSPDVIEVRRFTVEQVDAPGRIAIDGLLAPAGAIGMTIEIAALPVGPILALIGAPPRIHGFLYADAELSGTAGDPVLDAEFDIQNGRVNGLAYHHVQGNVEYGADLLTVTADAQLDGGGPVEFAARIPVVLTAGIPPSAELLDAAPLRAELLAEGMPLSALEGAVAGITDVEGVLSARAIVTGTADAPVLEGRVLVMGGAVTIPDLEQRYEQIEADLVLEGQTLRVGVARARSGGLLDVTGDIVFPSLSEPVAALELNFDGFRAFGFAEGDDAAIYGVATIDGPLASPVIAGEVRLDDGDLEVTELLAGDGLDEDLGTSELPGIPDLDADTARAAWLEAITVDSLVVRAGNDLWVVTDELDVQLSGEVVVFVAAGEARLLGELEGDRGSFTLEVGPIVRRFNVVEASIRFLGESPPDPMIAITASWVVPGTDGERREILAQVEGTLSSPSLSLGTADGVQIPETELLSFILFGQPSFEFGGGILPGAAVFENLFVGGLTQLATIQLEEAVLRDLGLPLYQFEIRTGVGGLPWLSAPIFVFGIQVAEDVYLTVESGFGMLFGGTGVLTDDWSVSLEWQIDPEWTLLLAYEPLSAVRLFRPTTAPLPTTVQRRQFLAEIRRRWTY